MKAKIAIVLGFALAVAAVLWVTRRGGGDGGGSGTAQSGKRTGSDSTTPAQPGPATEIGFLYSTEKREWLEAAVTEFQSQNPAIKVVLRGMGSIEAVSAILDGKEKPVLWSPADSMVLAMLRDEWQTKNGTSLFAAEGGEDEPTSLVLTPLVFAVWQDRAEVLRKAAGGRISWSSIHKAVTSNQGWPAIGGNSAWGFVKLGHTDPTRSNSGLQTLLLMTYEYYNKTRGLAVGDLLDPRYQQWIQEIESGVSKFETSTGTFMTDMIRFGPSKYDIAMVYENLAISQLANAQGRWGNLMVFYPPVTLWSDHPVGLLHGDWVSAQQTEAGRKLIAFLRSRPIQQRALQQGFRPADTAVPIRTADGTNPWTRLAEFGIQVEVPPAAELPDGPVARNLMTMWRRVVGSR
jgi:ABC-type Fe3+ transport system substrate-binding protein